MCVCVGGMNHLVFSHVEAFFKVEISIESKTRSTKLCRNEKEVHLVINHGHKSLLFFLNIWLRQKKKKKVKTSVSLLFFILSMRNVPV